MADPSHHRRTVYYSGRVQGVGFRYMAQAIARGHDVTGYVQNLPDGRVELVVEGDHGSIEAFLSEIRERMASHIRDERSDQGPATGEYHGFEIRH
jgi:acylphosphatase